MITGETSYHGIEKLETQMEGALTWWSGADGGKVSTRIGLRTPRLQGKDHSEYPQGSKLGRKNLSCENRSSGRPLWTVSD
jgi:hypothetical protein